MKRSIRVVMKSGFSFSFLCDTMKVKKIDGELLAFSYDGATANFPMFVRIDNVDAIIDEGNAEEGSDGN